jgi:hypothetical protein
MQRALRPYLRPYMTAGIVVVGAGLIAVTPMGPSASEIQNWAVRLASADAGAVAAGPEYPIYTFQDLVTQTTANIQGLQTEYAADPTPIWTQLVDNWTTYWQDISTAMQNADSYFMTDLDNFPGLLQTWLTDLSQGDVFDVMTGVQHYLQGTLGDLTQPVTLAETQIFQEMSNNVNNVIQDAVGGFARAANATAGQGFIETGPWLTLLMNGPEFAPNAAYTAAAGVEQDIVNAVNAGDYTAAWNDLLNAPTTILYGYLDGYPLNTVAPFAATEALARAGLPSDFGLLTNQTVGSALVPTRGGLENVLDAKVAIARDITPAERAFATDPVTTAAVTDPAGSLAAVEAAINTDFHDLLQTLFDPTAATDLGATLSTEFGDLTTNVGTLFTDLTTMF